MTPLAAFFLGVLVAYLLLVGAIWYILSEDFRPVEPKTREPNVRDIRDRIRERMHDQRN